MDKREPEDALVRERPKDGIEIIPGTFVINKAKFLTSQFLGLRSKSKIVRNASRHLLMAYSLTTGELIEITDEIPDKPVVFK